MSFKNRETLQIYSETPYEDIWRRLRSFVYPENVSALIRAHHKAAPLGADLVEDIAASIEQAGEYFAAARSATLSTVAVHLYYGTISLLRALALTTRNSPLTVRDHGMTPKIAEPADPSLGNEAAILTGSPYGGLEQYCAGLSGAGSVSGGCSISLASALACIPELREEFVRWRPEPPRTIPVSRTVYDDGTILDQVADATRLTELAAIPRLDKSYLRPSISQSGTLLLRPRIGQPDDPTLLDTAGRRFLFVGATTSRHTAHCHPLTAHVVALFILCSLSRYRPSTWRSFCGSSGTSRRLVEEFFLITARYVPNEVLSLLEGRRLLFSSERGADVRKGEVVSSSDVQGMVRAEVAKYLAANRGQG